MSPAQSGSTNFLTISLRNLTRTTTGYGRVFAVVNGSFVDLSVGIRAIVFKKVGRRKRCQPFYPSMTVPVIKLERSILIGFHGKGNRSTANPGRPRTILDHGNNKSRVDDPNRHQIRCASRWSRTARWAFHPSVIIALSPSHMGSVDGCMRS